MLCNTMSDARHDPDSLYPGPATAIRCPQCDGVAYRVPRHWIDRITSLWRPVQRFECQSTPCRHGFTVRAGTPSLRASSGRR